MSTVVPRPRRRVAGSVLVAVAGLLGAVGVDVGLASAAAAPVARPGALLSELRRVAGGTARVAADGIGGTITFVGGSPRAPLRGPDDGDPDELARTFVDHYGTLYGVGDPGDDLVVDRQVVLPDGSSAVRFRQEVDGVPVLAGEVAVQIAESGAVLSTAGEALPTSAQGGLDTDPAISAAAAARAALAVTTRDDAVPVGQLTTSTPELLVFDPRLIGAPVPGGPRLTWHVDVRTELGEIDRFVLVDATDGSVAFTFSQRADALIRQVCDNGNVPQSTFGAAACNTPVRSEGQGSVANNDVNLAYDLSGATYQFYLSWFGRDSVDGAGMPLRSTVRFCIQGSGCPYGNAFWNGAQMVYGQGYASADDVVAHELTHGVTDHTSNLLYFGEAGAINESVSDVMGELMDLQHGSDPPGDRWLLGEDTPIGAIRDMEDPTRFGDPDRMGSPLYESGLVDSGGVHINSGVGNKAASLLVDGGTFNGRSISGIGPVATGRIWYQAETTLLGPGTDYLDLSRSLQQACTNLIGSAGIGAAECESVRRAVEATEMDAAAGTHGVHLVAPVCPADAPLRTDLFVDDFEAGLTRWNTSAGGAARSFETFEGSSQSGTTSMFVDDPAGAGVAQARMAGGVPIPAGVRTYLRFDHSFHFDYSEGPRRFWDGGLVGISTTGPTGGYADVGTALPADAAVNGYNGVLVADDPNTQVIESRNQYHGRPAFGGVTQTYQSTRYELTSLAGKLAFVGFFMGSDSSVGATGWFIDDVAIYTCSSDAPPASSGFTAVGPERVFDTRGESANALVSVPVGRVAPGSPLVVPVAGLAGGSVTPVSGVGAVSLNVAVTNPAAAGFVTVFPCANRRLVASVNFGAGQTVSNAVVAPVSAGGTVCFFSLVPTDVVVDINGWFAAGSSYSAVGPERVFDTRGESPGALVPVPLGKVGPSAELGVQVTGLGAAAVTPVSGVGAVSLNVAVTNPAAAGFVTVYPCANRRLVASVNFGAGQTVSNAVIAPVSAVGTVCFFSLVPTDIVVDINGWFSAGASYSAVGPERVFDTRGESANALVSVPVGRVAPGSPLVVPVAGLAGGSVTPVSGVGAVSLNVAVTNPAAAGFVTVFPCANRRLVASVNFGAGQTVSNAVVAPVSAAGTVCFFSLVPTDVVVDINGWFAA